VRPTISAANGYRHLQSHGIEFGAAGGAKTLQQPITQVLHQFAVTCRNHLGREKKRAVALRCFWCANYRAGIKFRQRK
jgi:hypothetical protein